MKKRIVMAALAATMLIGMNASQAFVQILLERYAYSEISGTSILI